MAKKKIKKPVYVTKEERRKLQKKPLPMKTKIIIGSVVGAVLLALILFLLLYNDGALAMKGGVVQEGGDNWLVTNLNKQNRYSYYKQAEVNAAEGYTLDAAMSAKSDTNETAFWFTPDGEDTPVRSYYVTGNVAKASELAESARTNFIAYYGEENTSELASGPVGGIVGTYFTSYIEQEVPIEAEQAADEETLADAEAPEGEEVSAEAPVEEAANIDEPETPADEPETADDAETPVEPETRIERQMQLVAYFPAYRNSSIIFVLTVNIEEGAEIPTMEEMLALADPLARGIEIVYEQGK